MSIKDEAETLITSGILSVPLNKRGKEDNKIDRITKIRVDFTIRKNAIAKSGPKMIYLRILRPDKIVLGSSEPGVFQIKDGELPFSAKREIIYENDDIPVSIFWDNNGDLISGLYQVELYSEGKNIGNAEFALKEGRLF